MFLAVEQWLESGMSKSAYLKGKGLGLGKFNYWIAKWKASRSEGSGFKEVNLMESGPKKVLEITTVSGTRITVFA
jgi:hypothetical protein